MTRLNFPLKAAATLSILAMAAITAPNAFAGNSAYAKAADRVASKVQAQRQNRGANADRGNRRSDRGIRHNDRRANRGARNNDRRTNRGTRNDDRRANRGQRVNTHSSRNRGQQRSRIDRSRQRDNFHQRNTRDFRYSRGNNRHSYRANYRPASFGNFRRGNGFRQNGFNTNYRSGLGINFSFGNPGFSSYRWAPSNFGLYRPGRVSFASYRNQTRCDRVIVDGFQYGTLRPVSVTQCFNPWDGYYIIQGSERIAHKRW